MGLPYSRNQSYVATTPVASADLNDLQDWEVRAWDALAGKDFLLSEDFHKDITQLRMTQLAGANSTYADDSANDGFGVMSLAPANNSHETWDSPAWPLSGRRWRLTFRMRWGTVPPSINSFCAIGIYSATGPTPFYWKCIGGGGSVWKLNTAGGDTASAQAMDTLHHLFELRCDGANLTAYLDGVLVATFTAPVTFVAKLHLDVFRANGDGAVVLLIDSLRFWAAR